MIEVNGKKAYTVNEAAAILGTFPQLIRIEINKNKIKAYKIGKAWHINQNDLAEYIKERGVVNGK